MKIELADGLATRLKIGMEVHVELATRTKMWTGAPNAAHRDYFDAPPNTLLDPVILGLPGALPVMNGAAVEMSIRVGLALNCQIARFTKWDRKSYYYPDLPKNYQISQYDLPLCGEGVLEIPTSEAPGAPLKPVRILRAHLEEDAGKLMHEAPGGRPIDYSIADLNRAGTPLLEIVTHPDLSSADEAVMFARTLRNICRFLGVSEGIMQRGHMRFEPNINVLIERDGRTIATPIVEVKNLNSFRSLHAAITFEHQRQVEQWLEDGQALSIGSKSTRGWDDVRGVTFLQREKEEAHDYRYFPDPDLLPVTTTAEQIERLRATLPQLPLERARRYATEYGLPPADARALVEEREEGLFFESVVAAGVPGRRAAAIVRNNLARRANERGILVSELGITAPQVAAIDAMQGDNRISSNAADELYGLCCDDPAAEPAAIAQQRGLIQISDRGQLDKWIDHALSVNARAVEQIRGGKVQAIGALVGAVMKLSGGKANPKVVQERLRQKLGVE
jgi:aspartyl-tRNA(Asn)/glutamyl-tRNA(Gln) amidotransferase subunit B